MSNYYHKQNNERINILEKTFKDLLGQLKVRIKHNINIAKTKENKKTIVKLNTVASGGDVDVGGAWINIQNLLIIYKLYI